MDNTFYTFRNYGPGDFAAYVQLHMETTKLDRSGGFFSKKHLAEDLGHPSFQPENDLFIAEYDGHIIGCAVVFLEKTLKRAILRCLIHPHHRRKGIATELFQRASQHAEEAESRSVQVCIPQNNQSAIDFALGLGFKFIRLFFELQLNLSSIQLPDPEPSEYNFRSLKPDEADKLTDIQNRAFADSWGFNPNTPEEIAYRINLSSCSPENIILACLKNKPVGYCWTRTMITDSPAAGPMKGEIHMLGVDPDFRKKRIGRNVLLAGLSYLKSREVNRVELTADGEDSVAMGLYKSVGFKVCSRAEWYEKRMNY